MLACVVVAGCSTTEGTEAGSPSPVGAGPTDGSSGGAASGATAAPAPTDGTKNGAETDVDCGGAGDAPRCADGKACATGDDCASKVCKDKVCQAPADDDGVMNADETDVDCGGTVGKKRCAVDKACKAHADCESDGCGYKGKCVSARSCAGHFGGDTCGEGEVGEPGAKHESCCASAKISNAANATLLDKYVITAGRMRQFIERTKGNVRGFVETQGNNKSWNSAWNDLVPQNMGEANFVLGPQGHGTARRGCDLNDSRGRTYWMSNEENDALGDGHHSFNKDILDQKALNCVEFALMQALCVWDGGHLATQAEIQTAWQAGEGRVYPWGGASFNANADADKVVFGSNYQFPEQFDQGNFIYIAAPGRRPAGNGKFGHADLAGLVIEITGTVNGNSVVWGGNGSWEGHGISPNGAPLVTTSIDRAYWAAGGRCAH